MLLGNEQKIMLTVCLKIIAIPLNQKENIARVCTKDLDKLNLVKLVCDGKGLGSI